MPSVFFFQSQFFDLKIEGFQIPASAMNLFDTFSILLMIQLMEHLIYPLFQYLNVHLTTLRRMGFGFFLVTLSMVYAALIEPHRRQNVDFQNTNVIANTTFNCSNYTVLWQAPQFVLIGFSEFFINISGKFRSLIIVFIAQKIMLRVRGNYLFDFNTPCLCSDPFQQHSNKLLCPSHVQVECIFIFSHLSGI